MKLSEHHHKELKNAVQILENPGITAKITNLIGRPIEKAFDMLPEKWNKTVTEITTSALMKSLDAALLTLNNPTVSEPSNVLHKISVASSGAIGGFFGITFLAIELPFSTTIMLRSIADIARSEGESITDPEVKLACIEVFALGGKSSSDDSSESGYFAIRAALAKSISEAAQFATSKKLTDTSAPQLIKFIVRVANRFSIPVTEKAVAQGLPAVGALGGAVINTIFIDHFQCIAKGHFTVRRLERIYGKENIKQKYNEILKGK